jgi:hypothetical protein
MLDFIGLVITTALMVLIVNALIVFIDASRAAKVALAAVVVCPDGVGSNMAHPACDHCCAAPARQTRPSSERGCLTS